ncbi:MAG TPA: hypothetical protein VI521_00300 [Candidatus Babeliales bacterium]|nr:hypothetical protein [Candidatus Babeliales bacterium]
MKKHLIVAFCCAALSGLCFTLTAVQKADQENLLLQAIESELAATEQSEQAIQKRMGQLPSSQDEQNVSTLDKQIAQEQRKLSQLKRTRARLFLKRAEQLKRQQGE